MATTGQVLTNIDMVRGDVIVVLMAQKLRDMRDMRDIGYGVWRKSGILIEQV